MSNIDGETTSYYYDKEIADLRKRAEGLASSVEHYQRLLKIHHYALPASVRQCPICSLPVG